MLDKSSEVLWRVTDGLERPFEQVMLPELSIVDNGNGLTGQQIYECSRSCVREERLLEVFAPDGIAARFGP
jgi:hypothetical protein